MGGAWEGAVKEKYKARFELESSEEDDVYEDRSSQTEDTQKKKRSKRRRAEPEVEGDVNQPAQMTPETSGQAVNEQQATDPNVRRSGRSKRQAARPSISIPSDTEEGEEMTPGKRRSPEKAKLSPKQLSDDKRMRKRETNRLSARKMRAQRKDHLVRLNTERDELKQEVAVLRRELQSQAVGAQGVQEGLKKERDTIYGFGWMLMSLLSRHCLELQQKVDQTLDAGFVKAQVSELLQLVSNYETMFQVSYSAVQFQQPTAPSMDLLGGFQSGMPIPMPLNHFTAPPSDVSNGATP